jgi:type II secretory pathway component GspD/PulD (secretin)
MRGGHVAVHQAQLSVDLQNADVAEVLSQIESQTAITINVNRMRRHTISAQFSNLELEQGLRRLLRLASLNYAILYQRGPGGTVDIQEVWVFDLASEAATPRLIAEPNITGSADEAHGGAGPGFAEAFAPFQDSSPEDTAEESDAIRQFREALARRQTFPAEPAVEPANEAIRRFRAALQAGHP